MRIRINLQGADCRRWLTLIASKDASKWHRKTAATVPIGCCHALRVPRDGLFMASITPAASSMALHGRPAPSPQCRSSRRHLSCRDNSLLGSSASVIPCPCCNGVSVVFSIISTTPEASACPLYQSSFHYFCSLLNSGPLPSMNLSSRMRTYTSPKKTYRLS